MPPAYILESECDDEFPPAMPNHEEGLEMVGFKHWKVGFKSWKKPQSQSSSRDGECQSRNITCIGPESQPEVGPNIQ